MHLLHAWAAPGCVIALTVDHRLREGSDHEAAQVGLWCKALGVPHRTLVREAGAARRGATASPQAAAREARYGLLEGWCRREGVRHLFIAHHGDDQVETFLMRLARGSGLDGLAAMAPKTCRGSITVCRPLLGFAKTELEATCRVRGQRWIEDPSNRNPASTRVRFRQTRDLLAAEGLTDRRLLATIGHLQRARAALNRDAETLLAECCDWNGWGGAEVRVPALLRVPEEIALRVLSHILSTTAGAHYGPRFQSLERLWRTLQEGGPRGVTLCGCILRRRGDALAVWREPAAIEDRREIARGNDVLWDGRFQIALGADAPDQAFAVSAATAAAWRLALAETPAPAVPAAARGTVPMLADDKGVAMLPAAGFIRLDLRPFWQAKVDCRWIAARVHPVAEITPFAEM
jgi:tRNA(Ile)-lysidine synthase